MENVIPTSTVFVIIVALRVLYSSVIFYLLKNEEKRTQAILTALSFLLPITTGVICIIRKIKQRKRKGKSL